MKDWIIRDVDHGGLVEDVDEQVIALGILNLAKTSLTAMKEARTKGDNGKSLSYPPDIHLSQSPIILMTQLQHQSVISKVGDIVAWLPDGHLHPRLDCAVLLKPSMRRCINQKQSL